jgi:hypothetical protein
MSARIPHHGHHEIRRAVDHAWLIGEIGVRVYKSHQFDNTDHAAEVATTSDLKLGQPTTNPSGPLEIWPEICTKLLTCTNGI